MNRRKKWEKCLFDLNNTETVHKQAKKTTEGVPQYLKTVFTETIHYSLPNYKMLKDRLVREKLLLFLLFYKFCLIT